MDIVSKDLQYSDTGHGVVYGNKAGKSFVFALSNYSCWLQSDNEEQSDKMQWDNSYQSLKSRTIDELKDIMEHIGRDRRDMDMQEFQQYIRICKDSCKHLKVMDARQYSKIH